MEPDWEEAMKPRNTAMLPLGEARYSISRASIQTFTNSSIHVRKDKSGNDN